MTVRVPRQQRGEQRRDALLAAATAVMAEHGPAAFSARAVAGRAGLPLAAVSYYFPQLDVLLAESLTVVLRGRLRQAIDVVTELESAEPAGIAAPSTGSSADPIGGGAVTADPARAITAALLPPGDRIAVARRYEHLLAAAGHPVAAAAMADLRPRLRIVVARILRRTATETELTPDSLISLLDGAAVGALSEGAEDPHHRVEATLREALTRWVKVQPIQSSNDRPEIRS